MRISRLSLKNWRNFRNVEVCFAERIFLVGPNASGKSNLLDVFRFLRDIAKPDGGLQRAVAQRGGLSKIRCLSARREPDVEISVELADNGSAPSWKYEIGITQQLRGRRQALLRFERVWKGSQRILERPDAYDHDDKLRLTQTHLEQISANSQFRSIGRFLDSIRYLHLVPQLLRYPQAYQVSVDIEDPHGRNFLELVARTDERTRRFALRRIEAALREAVPQLRALTYTKDESGIPHLEAAYEHWHQNAKIREDQFSDGTLRLIGLFWSLLEGDSPLLLEEPELSLHSAIVKRLPALFYRLQRKTKRQMFVSTHSWDLLSEKGIGGEEVVLLTPGQEGTKVELASSIEEVRRALEAGLSVADVALPLTMPSTLKQLDLFE